MEFGSFNSLGVVLIIHKGRLSWRMGRLRVLVSRKLHIKKVCLNIRILRRSLLRSESILAHPWSTLRFNHPSFDRFLIILEYRIRFLQLELKFRQFNILFRFTKRSQFVLYLLPFESLNCRLFLQHSLSTFS